MNTDLIGIINVVSGIMQIGIGLIAFFSDTSSKIKRYYLVSAFFLGAWSLSIFFYSNPYLLDSTTWLRIVYTFAYAMTLGLILFATVFPKESITKLRIFFWIILVLMLGGCYLLWFTDTVLVSSMHIPNENNSLAVMGPLYLLYGLPEFITAIYIVRHYLIEQKNYIGIERRQIQFYVIGGVIMLIPVFIFDFFIPVVFGDTSFYKYSTIGNSIWTLLVGYSILKTRFLDIKVVLGSIVVMLAKALLLIFGFVGIFLIARIADLDLNISSVLKLFPVAVIFSIVITKLFPLIEEFFSTRFIYVVYHPVKTLQEYNREISKILDIGELVKSLRKYILNSFKPDFVEAIVINKVGNIISGSGKDQSVISSNEVSAILNVWENLNSNRILIFSELEKSKRSGKRMLDENRDSILKFMNSKNIEIIYPLDSGDGYSGLVVLGRKSDRSLYTVTDINFLESMIQTAQVSFQRAILYLEVEMLNRSLQEKVDEQTKELKLKVAELEEARKKENDMIDIMGHELRTPATVVKLNAQLLEKYINSNPQDFNRYLDRIKRAVETEIGLINTLLTSAKLEGNKVEIGHDKVDIKKEIDMAIHGHEIELQEKGLEYIDRTEGYQSFVYGDRVRVAEILNNLVSNAIKYTEKGYISIYTKHDDEYVTVSVQDTGKGIPDEKMSIIGKKFGRVDNYLGSEIVRPGGTGLGLYVTFGLVKLMGGDIWIDSEVGKGSKFTFRLPIYNGQKIDPECSNNMFEKLGLKK